MVATALSLTLGLAGLSRAAEPTRYDLWTAMGELFGEVFAEIPRDDSAPAIEHNDKLTRATDGSLWHPLDLSPHRDGQTVHLIHDKRTLTLEFFSPHTLLWIQTWGNAATRQIFSTGIDNQDLLVYRRNQQELSAVEATAYLNAIDPHFVGSAGRFLSGLYSHLSEPAPKAAGLARQALHQRLQQEPARALLRAMLARAVGRRLDNELALPHR